MRKVPLCVAGWSRGMSWLRPFHSKLDHWFWDTPPCWISSIDLTPDVHSYWLLRFSTMKNPAAMFGQSWFPCLLCQPGLTTLYSSSGMLWFPASTLSRLCHICLLYCLAVLIAAGTGNKMVIECLLVKLFPFQPIQLFVQWGNGFLRFWRLVAQWTTVYRGTVWYIFNYFAQWRTELS